MIAELRTFTFTREEAIVLSIIIHTCLDELAPKVAELDQDQRAFYAALQHLGKAIPKVERKDAV